MNYQVSHPAFATVTPICAAELAVSLCHRSKDTNTTLLCHEINDEVYEMRLCGSGAEAFFEWIDESSDPVGDSFAEIDCAPETEIAKLGALLQRALTPTF